MANGILLLGGPFQIGGMFVPDVTVEAVGQDALGITGAPVETGATMTDHSFKLPVRLEMVAGWSDCGKYNGYIRGVYEKLLRLQATRLPFSIFTSRRRYQNMLMESITDPISANTYTAMLPRITFRELIISRTQTSNEGTTQVGAGAPAGMQPPVDRGTVTGQPVGSQAFAGAYNPGDYSGGTGISSFNPGGFNPDGGTVGNGSFNLGPLPGSPVLDPNLSGISPPMSITLPEISVTAGPEAIGGLQAAGPDQYNIFGGGP